jgi:glycerol-1-phosphate dehydrogenase [NAD(P)+]
MIGKYVALTDWKIASLITKEFYCERIAKLTLDATQSVLNSVDGIMKGEDEAYEKLTYGLLLSGIAMQMMKNSRPASGSEHHISHFIEIEPKSLPCKSTALHGEKVGVGTLMALREYKRLATIDRAKFIDYLPYADSVVENIFGKDLAVEILNENKNDCATRVKGKDIEKSWKDICNIIADLPDPEYLLEVYALFNAKKNLEDIEVSENYAQQLIEYSHLVRNRLTLMRLRKCIKG